jgi:isocitrate lyase
VGRDKPWLQFEYTAEVPDAAVVEDDSVEAAVDRIVSSLRTTDPKTMARVCGGSREHAAALGYPWPP